MKWALGLVLSRAWGDVNYTKREGFHRMLPLADIANHANEGHGSMQVLLYADTQEVRMVIRGSLRRGEEVFTSYGEYGNHALLAQYGFILPDNVHHRIRAPAPALSGSESETESESGQLELERGEVWKRAELLRGAGLAAGAVAVTAEGRPSAGMMEYHRLEVLRPGAASDLILAALLGKELPLPLELRALHRLSWSLRRLREEREEVLATCRGAGGLRRCDDDEGDPEGEGEGGTCLSGEGGCRVAGQWGVVDMALELAVTEVEMLDKSIDEVRDRWHTQLDREEEDRERGRGGREQQVPDSSLDWEAG